MKICIVSTNLALSSDNSSLVKYIKIKQASRTDLLSTWNTKTSLVRHTASFLIHHLDFTLKSQMTLKVPQSLQAQSLKFQSLENQISINVQGFHIWSPFKLNVFYKRKDSGHHHNLNQTKANYNGIRNSISNYLRSTHNLLNWWKRLSHFSSALWSTHYMFSRIQLTPLSCSCCFSDGNPIFDICKMFVTGCTLNNNLCSSKMEKWFFWLAFLCLICPPSYRTQYYHPRDSTTNYGLCTPPLIAKGENSL